MIGVFVGIIFCGVLVGVVVVWVLVSLLWW